MSEVRFSEDYRGGGTFYITQDEAEIDLSDIIGEIPSEAMVEELNNRGEGKLSNADDDEIIKEVSERSLIRYVLEDESIEDVIDILGVEEVLAEIDADVMVDYVRNHGYINEVPEGVEISLAVAEAFRTVADFLAGSSDEFAEGKRFIQG